MSDDEPKGPIEIWNIERRPVLIQYGPRAALDQRIAELARQQAEDENEQLRGELLYKQVLEKFNRAHGQNPKTTLKAICKQMGVSYEAVKKYRQRARKPKGDK